MWRSMLKNRRITGINRLITNRQEKITVLVQAKTHNWFIDFKANGVVTVYCENMGALIGSFEELDTMFKTAIHPVIQSINENLESTGFSIPLYSHYFTTGPNSQVLIENLAYQCDVQLPPKTKLMDTLQCCTNLFIPMKLTAQVAELNYKRISEFKRMSPELVYLIQQIDVFAGELQQRQLVYDQVLKYFPYLDQAKLDALYIQGLEPGSDHDISPGFPTVVTIDDRRQCTVIVQGIASLNYVPLIRGYWQSLLEWSKAPDILCKTVRTATIEEAEDDDNVVTFLSTPTSESDSDSDNDSDSSTPKKNKKIGYIGTIEEQDDSESETQQQPQTAIDTSKKQKIS